MAFEGKKLKDDNQNKKFEKRRLEIKRTGRKGLRKKA